jgi:hypothetical protein
LKRLAIVLSLLACLPFARVASASDDVDLPARMEMVKALQKGDLEKGGEIAGKLHKRGSCNGTFWVAVLTLEGKGGYDKDPDEAVSLLRGVVADIEAKRKPWDQFCVVESSKMLGKIFEAGYGVKKDLVEAANRYGNAIVYGDEEAVYGLARIYKTGKTKPSDWNAAYARACGKTGPAWKAFCEAVEDRMTGGQIREAKEKMAKQQKEQDDLLDW